MKRLLTILIFLSVLFVAGFMSQVNLYTHIVFPVCFGLSLLIFIGFIGYVKFGLKKKIFVWILASLLFLPFNATPSFADSSSKVDEQTLRDMANYNESKKDEVCKYVDELNGEGQTNEEAKAQMYDDEILKISQKIIDNAAKLNNSGSKSSTALDEAYRCAKAYAEKAGEVQKSFSQKCSPFTELIKSYINRKTCWPCSVTAMVIASIQRVVAASYDVVRNIALLLLGFMFLFWLAYVTLAFFGKFGFARISEYLTSVLNKTVLVVIIAALLHAPLVKTYEIVLSPVVQYAAGIAISISNMNKATVNSNKSLINKIAGIFGKPKCTYCDKITSSTVENHQFLDQGSINAMLCMICQVNQQVTPMISLGQAITCYSSAAPKSKADNPTLSPLSSFGIPSFTGLFFGMFYVIMFSLLMVIISFHLMGATLRLGFVIALMPIWLVFFAFKTTRLYTTKAWTLLLHALSGIVSLSLATGIILIGFNTLVPTKALIGFVLTTMKSSPTELLQSFGAVFDGSDPFSSGDSSSSGSWADGITDALVDYAITSITGYSAMQTVILFALFAVLSIQLVDKSAEFMERLLSAWIGIGNAGAQGMTAGVGTGLKAVGSMSRTGGYVASGAKSMLVGAAAGIGAKKFIDSNNKKDQEQEKKSQEQNQAQEAAKKLTENAKNTASGTK